MKQRQMFVVPSRKLFVKTRWYRRWRGHGYLDVGRTVARVLGHSLCNSGGKLGGYIVLKRRD